MCGPISFQELYESECKALLPRPGVYVVQVPDNFVPIFLEKGTGGFFKGEDPNVSVETLQSRWVRDARELYIGMTTTNLQERVLSLLKFGQGKRVPHKGGRLLWQLKNSGELLLSWCENDAPTQEEARLLRGFELRHGRLPFANLKHGSEEGAG